ncbi:MAG: hypothetical protein ACI93R_001025 [Flavobacteriales bacterium]|jgi:hypothetical protein
MKYSRISQGISLSVVMLTGASYAQQSAIDGSINASDDVEELTVIGKIREGDYAFITEDTQKLVETAGSLGDPLSAVFSLPGVIAAGGEGGEPAVRGSSPADNSYIVDFLPASDVFHDFGVSVFSEFILHDFQMYSASFGPEYSGATGAIFDVTLRDPKNEIFNGVVDISMLRSGVFLESGLTENSAFYISARKSLLHVFVNNEDASDEEEGFNVKQIPEDTDYQFKYQWKPSNKHALTVSANGSSDDAEAEFTSQADFVRSNPDFEGEAGIHNSAHGESLLWRSIFDNGHELKVGAGKLSNNWRVFWGNGYSQDINLAQKNIKAQYTIPLGERFKLTLGGENRNYDYHYYLNEVLFVCTEFDVDCSLNRRERIEETNDLKLNEKSVYVNSHWSPVDRIDLDLGFQQQKNDYTNETFHHPRIAASLQLNDTWKIHTKAGSYNRFPDLETILPEIGNPNLHSPRAEHFTLGVMHTVGESWNVSLEGYYKTLEDLPLALRNGDIDESDLYSNDTKGKAYGVDLLINKNLTDKWYSWVSLSYGKSNRTNERTSVTRDYYLDTPVIANWVLNYQATSKFNISWRWTARSGAANTPITGVQDNPFFEGAVLPEYGDAYSERLPLYSRLDLRFKWDMHVFGLESALMVDIINATNRQNVTERTLDFDRVNSTDDPVLTEDTVGNGIQPALTYRVIF